MTGWVRNPETHRLVRSEPDPDLEMAQERPLSDIFSRVSMIFRVCVNFSGIFGAVYIFPVSFRINILFAFFCTIQGQKKIRKNESFVIVWTFLYIWF